MMERRGGRCIYDIARNPKCLRRQKGLTREKLTVRFHAIRQAMNSWKRNRSLPELKILLSVVELLGIGADELLYSSRPAERAVAPASRRRRMVITGALWTV